MIEYTVKVDDKNGNRFWRLNGKRHREDGPAVEFADGGRSWYLNGKFHREDGPAVEWADGDRSWYLNGTQLTEAEFNARQHPTCNGKVVEINGKKYRLMEV